MGFSNISSHLIIFIAVLVAASTVSVMLKHIVDSTGNSVANQQSRLVEQLDTDISIDAVHYDNTSNTISVYVRNIGSTRMKTDQIDLYINNIRISRDNMTVEVLNDTEIVNPGIWDPKELIYITANVEVSSGSVNQATVQTYNSMKDSAEFSV